jgi:hypothetical protein
MLTLNQASQFADIVLGHVAREYPNKLDHVLVGPTDLQSPRALHPIFYGSFDWHSCVHGYWLLAHLLRCHPTLTQAERIRGLFATSLTGARASGELGYLTRPTAQGFERPYGWAWLLMLAAELTRDAAEDRTWSTAMRPLAEAFSQRFLTFLPKATYPVRSGVHSNTAFALSLALEYAAVCRDAPLADAARQAAWRWYWNDSNCQAWEPSGEDFLSPALAEAECMRRVLPGDAFAAWFGRFLPDVERATPRSLFEPVAVSDRSDGRIAHLDGLNLSRGWYWASLAAALAPDDPRRRVMQAAAQRHIAASLPHITDDYQGEHWLATFACLALEAASADDNPPPGDEEWRTAPTL